MARAPSGRHPFVMGIEDRANDNEFLVSPITYGHQSLSDELIEAGLVTDEEMVIIRDPISGDWLVEDYAREAGHRCINLGRIARSGSSRIRSRVSVQAPSLPG